MLDYRTISDTTNSRGIDFFPLKALLILGYDISSPEFVSCIAQKDISHVHVNSFMDTLLHNFILPKNFGEDDIGSTIDSMMGHISSHKKNIDNNWIVITRIMFLYYNINPYLARNTYLKCSCSDKDRYRKGVDTCFYEPDRVCTDCEGYRTLRVRYEEFLKNVTLFELLLSH